MAGDDRHVVGYKWHLSVVYDDYRLTNHRDKIRYENYACFLYENFGKDISAHYTCIIPSDDRKKVPNPSCSVYQIGTNDVTQYECETCHGME